MNKVFPFAVMLSVSTLALSGCGKEATGQVAAVVNGEEITLQEVNAELQGANLPEDADREQAQRVALQRVLDRRLMAQVAREEGLDQTPDFLLRKRQLEEALLLQLMSQKIDQTVEVPQAAAIEKYIDENPALFAQRQIVTLDRIQFPALADMSRLKILEDDMSMAEVVNSLNELGIEFERGPAQIDTAQIGQARLDSINALPDGEPFVIVENGMVYVSDVVGSEPVAVADEERQPIAAAALRRQSLANTLKNRLETTKQTAEISYQEGFGPAEEAAEGTAAGTDEATSER